MQLLRKCILTRSQPRIEGPLGQPPFERPSIAKAITNFVLYKFNTLPQREWQTMYDLAKMFLHCFNHWNFETPSVRKLVSNFNLFLFQSCIRRDYSLLQFLKYSFISLTAVTSTVTQRIFVM